MSRQESDYHLVVQEVYRDAAAEPAADLCCVPQAPRYLPGLNIPDIMHEMNYGCGTTVHLQDMRPDQQVLYVGVGGGLEALQLAYFSRRPGGVIAVDPVSEMREVARRNLELAAASNPWFEPEFVTIVDGDALHLPVEDGAVDFAAQNCLFNIFKTGGDMERAFDEMHRVLSIYGRLSLSDPITPRPLPPHLVDDERLRAACISGCVSFEKYIDTIVKAGFGTVEVRSRRPYRMLDRGSYRLDSDLLLETVEVAAIKTLVPEDGPCVFTGRFAVYSGADDHFKMNDGKLLPKNMPVPVCDKTAADLQRLGRDDLTISEPTWHYQGGGCC